LPAAYFSCTEINADPLGRAETPHCAPQARLNFADLSPEFFADAVVRPVRQDRLQAIGQFGGRLVAVVFAPLGSEAISVVSMRRASRKEDI
jgi:uncharacterized protein